MKTIPKSAIKAAYQVAKRVYEKEIRRAAGIAELHRDFSLNRNTAGDIISNIKYMLQGKLYSRKNNKSATKYFLKMIQLDYGNHALQNALKAVERHLDYYENIPAGNKQPGIRNIVKQFRILLNKKVIKKSSVVHREAETTERLSSAFEGSFSKRFVTHRKREHRLRKAKINQALVDGCGQLRCEVPNCGFDFFQVYGEIGKGYAQVHHLSPLSRSSGNQRTTLDDLIVICANCHAIIHRNGKCRDYKTLIQQ